MNITKNKIVNIQASLEKENCDYTLNPALRYVQNGNLSVMCYIVIAYY